MSEIIAVALMFVIAGAAVLGTTACIIILTLMIFSGRESRREEQERRAVVYRGSGAAIYPDTVSKEEADRIIDSLLPPTDKDRKKGDDA